MPGFFQRPVFQYAFVGLLLLLTMATVFANYFSLDEAGELWEIRQGIQWKYSFNSIISDGRPIYAFLLVASLSLAKSIIYLKYLRLLSVLDLLCFAWLIFRFLKKHQMPASKAFISAVLIFTLPGICLYIPWAECWEQHGASIISFLAGILLVRTLGKHMGMNALSRWKENLYFILAIALQQVALLIYQNLALTFVIPAFFVLMLKPEAHNRSRFLFFLYVGLSFALSLIIYYKLIHSIVGALNIPLTNRAGFTTQYVIKLKWAGKMFLEASKLHLLLFKNPIRFLFPVLIGVLVIRDVLKKRFLDLFFLLAFAVMVFLPQLMVKECWTASRNFGLVSLLLAFYLVLRTGEFVPVITHATAGIVALVFTSIMCLYLREGWVKPEHKDYEFMKNKVDQLPRLDHNDLKVEVRPPEWNLHEKQSNIMAYADEFNDPIYFRRWPIVPSIQLMYSDHYPELSPDSIALHLQIRVLKKGESFTNPSGDVKQVDLNYQ